MSDPPVLPYAEHCASCTCRDHLSDDDLECENDPSPGQPRPPVHTAAILGTARPRLAGSPRRAVTPLRRRFAHLFLDLCCLAFLLEGVLAFDETVTQLVISQAWSPGRAAFTSALFSTVAIAIVFLVISRALRVTLRDQHDDTGADR